VALLADDAPAQILGRGRPRADDDALRLPFVRLRPGQIHACPPLGSPGLSRRQLRLQPSSGGVSFERLGRCLVLHNGVATDRGILRAGDVLTLQNQLVLLCVRRATEVPSMSDIEPADFGVADGDGIVGESEAAWRLRADLAHAAASGAHVLVLGESGTGKELAAHAVHRRSARSRRAFVSRSAAAIPPGLIDAELFGNRRDYPNAGMPEREGIVGAAHGGTLFLDEIGELGSELQAHLLRLLDAEGEYHRLGDAHPRRSDLRLVAATNRKATALKHDFAARFAVSVELPGLDARREDIPLIARHLLEEAVAAHPDLRTRFFEAALDGSSVLRLAPGFVEALLGWNWKGHVRELRALLWASIRASSGRYLTVPPEMMRAISATEAEGAVEAEGDGPPPRAIRAALARHAGNQSKAYSELGLPNRFALYRLMRKHGIDGRDERRRR
jgi:two-component system nitrogen regulation response regulator GlnG/two-component system response regulator HydG